MAFRKNITKHVYGLVVQIQNAYHRIEKVSGDKTAIEVEVVTYDNTLTHTVGSKMFKFAPSVDENSANFIKQGYEYLKTLDEYKDAIDV